jgi:hypothetical protein
MNTENSAGSPGLPVPWKTDLQARSYLLQESESIPHGWQQERMAKSASGLSEAPPAALAIPVDPFAAAVIKPQRGHAEKNWIKW